MHSLNTDLFGSAPPFAVDAQLPQGCAERRSQQACARAAKRLPNQRQRTKRFREKYMKDQHFDMAVSLAKISFNTREQFVDALRAAAIVRVEANQRNIWSFQPKISLDAVKLHADEALDAIYCDGLRGLEYNIRFTIDEIVREELAAARKTSGEWRFL
jgi:hypothetical protein